ncbi:MAG TPA: biopolymer transporter ExbD [Mucilaginibacter sp.]|nr:biopolymer transporter ExbD [Mucilaginibacter sp.]
MAELVVPGKNGKRSSLPKLPPRIDLTAMVDLAFLLITFFILTTSLAKPRAMPIAMPVGTEGGVGESTTMTVCLGKNNQALWYRGMTDKPLTTPQIVGYGKDGLRQAIVEAGKQILKTTGKQMMVIVRPSAHSKYADLVAAIDELNITAVKYYAIADISPKDVEMLKLKSAY